jgi:hypothetical protein
LVNDGDLLSSPDTVLVSVGNQPPVLDSIGAQTVDEGDTLKFRISATDPDADSIILSAENRPDNSVFIDSGNGAGSFVFTPDTAQAGFYQVAFIASDGVLSDSETVEITVNDVPTYVCGDVNGDGVVGPTDIVYLLNYLFRNGAPPDPLWVGDVNSDGGVTPSDVIYLLNYLFRDGPPPEC